jgi:hypothetical protein
MQRGWLRWYEDYAAMLQALAAMQLRPGHHVVSIGYGIGSSSRHLDQTYRLRLLGNDGTAAAATELTPQLRRAFLRQLMQADDAMPSTSSSSTAQAHQGKKLFLLVDLVIDAGRSSAMQVDDDLLNAFVMDEKLTKQRSSSARQRGGREQTDTGFELRIDCSANGGLQVHHAMDEEQSALINDEDAVCATFRSKHHLTRLELR